MRVLISSGGTEEAIDGVRRISNSSTGRTGAVIAAWFAGCGAVVTLVRSSRAARPESLPGASPITELTYTSYADLSKLLKKQLAGSVWDAVIHLAAVSDYSVAEVSVDGKPFPPGGPGKIGTGRELILTLKPTAKILTSLKDWSRNKSITVIGFKLTDGADDAHAASQVRAQFGRGGVDYVVHNDLVDITSEKHPAGLWGPEGLLVKSETKEEMARGLYSLLAGEIK